jgi:hypothetical protein
VLLVSDLSTWDIHRFALCIVTKLAGFSIKSSADEHHEEYDATLLHQHEGTLIVCTNAIDVPLVNRAHMEENSHIVAGTCS